MKQKTIADKCTEAFKLKISARGCLNKDQKVNEFEFFRAVFLPLRLHPGASFVQDLGTRNTKLLF